MSQFTRDGITFHYRDTGDGTPFVFQHGLGGDVSQPLSLYRSGPGIRLIAFDVRAHGKTYPLGDVEKLNIGALAADLTALLDHLKIPAAVVGGISLGSAVAARVALQFPARVLGLVLSRPAWIESPVPENVRIYALIASLIRQWGAAQGLEQFKSTPEYQIMVQISPDCAQSLCGQFEQPRAEEFVARLERLAADTPVQNRDDYRAIRMPTLILGNLQDPIHPWSLAEGLAQLIPGAMLRELTPKSVSAQAHAADVQRALDAFLIEFTPSANRFGPSRPAPCDRSP
jgi:pimeloyl-ACP methyl ester carboxylesterase